MRAEYPPLSIRLYTKAKLKIKRKFDKLNKVNMKVIMKVNKARMKYKALALLNQLDITKL